MADPIKATPTPAGLDVGKTAQAGGDKAKQEVGETDEFPAIAKVALSGTGTLITVLVGGTGTGIVAPIVATGAMGFRTGLYIDEWFKKDFGVDLSLPMQKITDKFYGVE